METKPIPGFPGYFASSDGRIWSCVTPGRKPSLGKERKELLGWISDHGYKMVNLGRRARFAVHQLIALVFIGPCPAGQEVRHWNGLTLDNRPKNLLYGTRSENNKDTVRHGRCNLINDPRRGSRHGMAKLDEAAARSIYARRRNGVALKPLALEFGVSVSTISLIAKGKIWQHSTQH